MTRLGGCPPEGAPEPPAKGRRSAGALQKRHPEGDRRGASRRQLWFQDDARRQQGPGAPVVAQGRACPRDASNRLPVGLHLLRRAPGHRRRRHPGDASVNAKVMDLFLAHCDTLDQDAHAVMMCDGAGCTTSAPSPSPTTSPWRCCRLTVPNSTPSSGFGSSERFLSLRVLDDTEAIIDACCWIDLIAEPDRMRTLCAYPWIMKVIS